MNEEIETKYNNNISSIETKIEGIEKNIKSLIKASDAHENELKDTKLKLKDFNILELFKSFGDSSEDGKNSKILVTLMDNLENKINERLKLTEEKMLKVDESNFKMVKEVQNIRNSQDLNNRNIESNKNIINEIYMKLKDMEKQLNIDLNEISNKNKDLENILNNNINPNTIKNSEDKKKLSTKNINNKESLNINLNDDIIEEMNKNIDEKLKEITKRIIDIEKSFKFLPNQSWVEEMKNEINLLKEKENKYALITDLNETNNISDDMRKDIKFLREQYEDLSNNQILAEDVNSLKRKLELINNKIQEIEELCDTLDNKINQNISSKISMNENNKKLLELRVYEEFKSQIIKEFTNVNDNFTHLRKLVDEILNSLKNKSSYKDLKSLEDEIIIKFEDLRLASTKKFADRIETIKNIKYLDQQIKNIVQVYIKKIDKTENWLLAKKPINSNICASCESYIGDLKDNSPYVPWNKYPLRDQGDKVYRLGNGFSKMLQMIQIEENDKKNNVNNNNIQNELSDYVKNMKTEKSDIDIISGDMSLNKTTTNSFFKSPQKNLPKIKKGMLVKAKSGINITECINNTIGTNNKRNNNNISINNNNIAVLSSPASVDHGPDNKNNQAELLPGEEEFVNSPTITKIKKKSKNE